MWGKVILIFLLINLFARNLLFINFITIIFIINYFLNNLFYIIFLCFLIFYIFSYHLLILNIKLNFQDNIVCRYEKASMALYTCKNSIGKKIKICHWTFTSVVRPMLLCREAIGGVLCSKEFNSINLLSGI